ncbi:MAG: gliding motility-associated C-terminal domain-containing protein [Sphingobacteriales bacterium]|nr:gliding motility-associated C-terminal domain-containing protein [Sphingobacteriales bacterium]
MTDLFRWLLFFFLPADSLQTPNATLYEVLYGDSIILAQTYIPILTDTDTTYEFALIRDCDYNLTLTLHGIPYIAVQDSEIPVGKIKLYDSDILLPNLLPIEEAIAAGARRFNVGLDFYNLEKFFIEKDTAVQVCESAIYELNGIYYRENTNIVDTTHLRKNACDTIYHYQIYFKGTCPDVFPSAFSPNDDGNNDTYRPLLAEAGAQVSSYQLNIYNRYGQLVFGSNDPHLAWDGTFNGKPQPVGVYLFYCTYQTDQNSKHFTEKGSITLIR